MFGGADAGVQCTCPAICPKGTIHGIALSSPLYMRASDISPSIITKQEQFFWIVRLDPRKSGAVPPLTHEGASLMPASQW